MPEENTPHAKTSGGFIAKVAATLFASILAPLLVGLGIRYLGPTDKPPPSAEPSKEKDNKDPALLNAKRPEPLHLNGKDLSGFNMYLSAHGRDQDPKRVFTVTDGILRISGEEYGYLATKNSYQHYTLHTEFKWGEKTWWERETKTRTSGIAVHADSEGLLEVALKGSYLCNVAEGKTGDISLMAGELPPCKMTAEIDSKKTKTPYFQYLPKGTKTTLTAPAWLLGLNHQPDFKDVKGFRGKNDQEKPTGQWNTLDIVCGPSNLVVILNGKTVNNASQLTRTKGKILFRSSHAEIFFRKIDVIVAEK